MTKEKQISLTKYVADMKSKLSSPVPEKHKGGEREYKAFLENEVRVASAKLEAAKLQDSK